MTSSVRCLAFQPIQPYGRSYTEHRLLNFHSPRPTGPHARRSVLPSDGFADWAVTLGVSFTYVATATDFLVTRIGSTGGRSRQRLQEEVTRDGHEADV